MNRTQRILAILLVLQIVASAVALWPRVPRTGAAGALFPDLKTADVASMSVSDSDGNAVRLRQVAGSWVLPDAGDYPAKADTITSVLDKVVALNSRRLVTRTSSSHKRLQVGADSFVRRVDLETAAGTRYTFYLGSSPSYGTTHVRVEGADETYLASDLTPYEFGTTPASWVDTAYFSVAQDQLSAVTVRNARGTLTFNRDAEGKWTLAELPAGQELNTEAVNTTVSRATSVTLTRPLGKDKLPAYGLDTPGAVVTLSKTDGQKITLLVGAQDSTDGSYVVQVSTSPYYVRASEYYVKPLVENALSDYVVVPATPTPTS